MAARIARHRLDRAHRVPGLRTLEEPRALAPVLRAHGSEHRLLIVDCLTLWLTNLLLPLEGPALGSAGVDAASDELVDALSDILVRHWTEAVAAGRALHQRLAAVCEPVTLMVAGRALRLPPAPEA